MKIDLPDSDTMFPPAGFRHDQQQLPRLSLSRHDIESAVVVEASLGTGSQQDDQQLQGPDSPEDVGPIVEYLTALKGAK